MKVIVFSGKAESGKDTAAAIMKEELEADGHKVLVTHFADLLKYICRSFFGWNGEKDEAGRTLLQTVGTDVVRAKDPDFWVRFVADVLQFFPDAWDFVLIPDCRFPNERDVLAKSGLDTTLVRIVRRNSATHLTPQQRRHPSECAMDNVSAGYDLHNNGTLDDLRRLVQDCIVQMTGYHQTSL